MQQFNLRKLIVLLLLITSVHLRATAQTEPQNEFLLNGTVTHNKLPLSNVNIVIQNSENGTKTDANGDYTIIVKTGDVLQFSHLGYTTITIHIKGDKKIINLSNYFFFLYCAHVPS